MPVPKVLLELRRIEPSSTGIPGRRYGGCWTRLGILAVPPASMPGSRNALGVIVPEAMQTGCSRGAVCVECLFLRHRGPVPYGTNQRAPKWRPTRDPPP